MDEHRILAEHLTRDRLARAASGRGGNGRRNRRAGWRVRPGRP